MLCEDWTSGGSGATPERHFASLMDAKLMT